MATIEETTTYAVLVTAREVLPILYQFPPNIQDAFFRDLKACETLDDTLRVDTDDKETAEGVLSLLNPSSVEAGNNKRVLFVPSFAAIPNNWRSYAVLVEGNEPITCTCPDFQGRNKSETGEYCKHQRYVGFLIEGFERKTAKFFAVAGYAVNPDNNPPVRTLDEVEKLL